MDILFDITKMCRICLKSESLGLVSIFNTAFTVRPADMVRKLDLFKIDVNDGLPTCLCQSCICRLLDAYNLKQQSELAEIRFREYLSATAPISYVTKNTENTKGIISSAVEDSLTHANVDKDEEIYEAMNAVCDIFDKNSTDDIEVNDDVLQDVVIDVNNLTKSETEELSEAEDNSKSNAEDDCEQLENQILQDEEVNATTPTNHKIKNRKKKTDLKAPDKCIECGKTFSYSGYLETHMRMHTGEKPFKCEICDRSFTQIGNLSLHKRIHTGERRYQCEICSKLFTTSSNLSAHKRCHSEIRNFKCKECFRTFKSQRELSNHSGTHTGIKEHVCEICHKAFYKLSYLNVHVRTIHKGERRYKCGECNKAFSNSSNLICHYRIHTGEKPYECKVCDAKFNQSSALVRHSKQHTKTKVIISNEFAGTNSTESEGNKNVSAEHIQQKYFHTESTNKIVEVLTHTEGTILELPKASVADFSVGHTSLHSYEFSKDTILDYSKNHQSFEFQ